MEYRLEFKLAINNHEAISLKMNHLSATHIPDAQRQIEAVLDRYAEKPTEAEPCEPCQPTQPECGICGEERVTEAAAELDRQMDKVSELAKAIPAPAHGTQTVPLVAGMKGLLRLHCPDCDASFVVFLKYPADTYRCKCGNDIDLSPCKLARFECDCPDCGRHSYGYTNDETAGFEINCVCGKRNALQWRNKTKSYSRKGV